MLSSRPVVDASRDVGDAPPAAGSGRWRWLPRHAAVPVLALLALASLSAWWAGRASHPDVAWPDECIYLTGARNVLERGTLHTNFYLTHSILIRGYPHRDVHMPGYVFSLLPFVWALGASLRAGVALNVLLHLVDTLLVLSIARRLLRDDRQAFAAAALFTILPPFPAYLWVVYPEHVVTTSFLAGLAWLVRSRGTAGAALAGVLFGLGPLFRETLVLALPLYLVRLERRPLLRGFLPAAAATLLVAVLPFAGGRAIHPNAIYPSAFEEARRHAEPLQALTEVLTRNLAQNVRLTLEAKPLSSPEDAALVFLLGLILAAAAGTRLLPRESRPVAAAAFATLAALIVACYLLYVVRLRGGVWGGVRAFMFLMPLLLIFATPLLFRLRRGVLAAALAAAVAAGFVAVDSSQIAFFVRYKSTNLEDQDRNARYLERYIARHHPARIVSRSFTYGLYHWPVEVIWSLPRGYEELVALEKAVDYAYISIHWKSPLRLFLIRNPRYIRVNKDDRGAEFLIFRRVY